MEYRKFVWKLFDKYAGHKHSHKREKARRVRQIEKGQLTKSNGLVKE